MLKDEKEEEIVEYLKEQGVTTCKRFRIKKKSWNCGNKYYSVDI